ncbi:MAG: LPS assembly protein LptD, partial [Pseudomonadota bacterium]
MSKLAVLKALSGARMRKLPGATAKAVGRAHSRGFFATLLTATALAVASPAVHAQNFLTTPGTESDSEREERLRTLGNEQLLLDADTLTLDQARNSVTVSGDVQIFFDGNSLEADRVVYDRGKGELRAIGKVRLIAVDGNVIRSEEVRLSEDFKEAFIGSLQLDGFDDTYFAATSATRTDGNRIVLKKGVYNVCGVCQVKPGRIPTWRIRAEEIIIDDVKQRVTYKDATFEILGVPVAYLPRFAHPDPRVKQKSGLLPPVLRSESDLGLGIGLPVYYAFSKSSDATITATPLTQQGLLGQIEVRRRFSNGAATVEIAGIDQQSPEEFAGESGETDFRGGLRTTGTFALNENWDAGWDILALSDRTFAEDYELLTERTERFTSNVFLTGLSDTKYFDARGQFFNILDEDVPGEGDLQNQQAMVHPVIDYDGIIEQAIAGGQLSYRTNLTSLSRTGEEITTIDGVDFLDGASGASGRASAGLEWKRRFIAPGGHVITPSVEVRGDVLSFNRADTSFAGIAEEDTVARGQITGGLEWRYPILITGANTSHIIEPIAQIFVSPDEQQIDEFLNEDSQTVLFDDTNLFQRNRFAGFDRIEGGTRANVGLTYQGQLTDWLTTDALVGQSYHLAGQNSFTEQGVASVYIENGLETDRSDIVSRLGFTAIDVFNVTGRARFEEDDLEFSRADVIAAYVGRNLQLNGGYTL